MPLSLQNHPSFRSSEQQRPQDEYRVPFLSRPGITRTNPPRPPPSHSISLSPPHLVLFHPPPGVSTTSAHRTRVTRRRLFPLLQRLTTGLPAAVITTMTITAFVSVIVSVTCLVCQFPGGGGIGLPRSSRSGWKMDCLFRETTSRGNWSTLRSSRA